MKSWFTTIKLFLIIQTLILIYLLGCSSFDNASELWEGVSDNRLRVIISEYMPHHVVSIDKDINISARERLNQRCSLLLAGYIVMSIDRNKSSYETDMLFNKLMDEAIKQGEIISIDCSENNHCRAIGEYNILEIQKQLEYINK